MTDPPPALCIAGIAARVHSIADFRLVPRTSSHCPSVMSATLPGAPIPMLLHRMSSRPKVLSASAIADSASAGRVMSPAKATAWPPSSMISCRKTSARSSDRLTRTTRAPSRANSSAIALPLPRPASRDAAPVTIATLPFSLPPILSSFVVRTHPRSDFVSSTSVFLQPVTIDRYRADHKHVTCHMSQPALGKDPLKLSESEFEKFAIGQSVPRTEDPRLLRGEGCFTNDFKPSDQASGNIFRSPYTHATIEMLDVSAALWQR